MNRQRPSITADPRRLLAARARPKAGLLSLALVMTWVALIGAPPSHASASGEAEAALLDGWLAQTTAASMATTPAPPAPLVGDDPQAGLEVGPAIETIRLRPAPKPGPFSMDLYAEGDFVPQQTKYWCIAAATQTMINIIEDDAPNRSKAFQKRLHLEARRLDERWDPFWERVAGEARWDKGLHGLGLRDWAGILTARGYGPYKVERAKTRKQAIRMAAKAIRLTGRPAGLVVWRGAHAWVMSGFTSTADPAYSKDFKVKTAFIEDPWYPSVSSNWGASRPPNSAVPARALSEDYLPYNRPLRKHPLRDGKYMLILPTLPAGTEVETAWS